MVASSVPCLHVNAYEKSEAKFTEVNLYLYILMIGFVTCHTRDLNNLFCE